MNTFKYMRKNLILLSVIAIFFLFSNTVFCEEDYDPEKILQIPHQNILNNESLPGTTGNTGALSFSIPIKVPPGKGGLQPELSLTYNSNSKRNGWVGVGWSLELDSIQRSTKTPMKLNDNDSFVYNGSVDLIQRTQWGNNYYGARIEGDFTKFNYLGSSTGWVIYLADGSKKFFGSSPESRVLAYNPYPWPGQRTTFKWLLDRIEDPNGNSISITYNNTTLPEGTSEYYINQINYSPGSSIKFIPEVRPDRHPVYNNYGRLEFTKRLKTIEVYGSGQQAHKYSLNYSTGHYGGTALESVQEYGSNFGSTVLPKTSFNYEPGADFTFDSKKTKTTEFENGMGLIHFADINGDGIKDLVKFQTRTPTRSPLLRVFLGANDGSFGSPIVYDTNAENIAGHIHFGDINGDGRADLLKSNTNETAIRVYLASSTVEGSFDYIGERSFSAGLGKTRLADVNGDGLPDLIELLNGWDGEESYGLIRVHISDGSGGFETNTIDTDIEDDVSAENCSIADPNGDGLSDIIIKKRWSDTGAGFEYTNSVYVYLANGDGTFGTEWIWNHSQPITTPLGIEFNFSDVLFGDLNGDGLSDLVVPTTHYLDPGNGTLVYTFLSDGFGGFVLPAKIIDTSQTQSFQGQVHVADINGDGFDDLIKFSSIAYPPSFIFNIHYYLGDGKGNFNYENAITSTKWGFGAVIDINGDGLADTLQFKSSDRGIDIYLAKIMSPSNISPDLLVGIDNGYGVTSDIDYKRSVLYPSVHKPSSEYPNAHLPFSTELVDSITINDGIGNSPTTTYDYFGAHYDVREREFLGLKKIIQDNPNNTTLTSEYAVNDYYLKGRAATLNYTDNSDFNLTTSAWEKIVIQDDIQNGFQKGAVWVRPDYINSSITSGGTNVPSNIDYDYTLTSGFGYASTITKSGAGASNHVETNIYANHGAWIWRLTDNRIQQDSTTARHTQFEYNGQGNLTLETHINNNGSNAIIQMPDYDSSGNLLTKIDPNNNTTTFTYYNGTSFLNEKNFEGLITTYSNFNQWGKPRTIVDENTLTTTYTYDNYGRVQKEDYPGPGYKDIVYNDTARPRYTIDRVYDGSGTFADTYKYTDGLDRVLQTTQRGISGANSTMRYSYDGAGRNWQTTGPFFTTDFSYASSSPAGVPYRNITSFDFVDRPRTIQTPHDDGSVATTTINYPGFNRIITDPDGRSTTEGRDFLGRIQTITEANNITSNYDYNAAGDLINVTGPLNNSIVLTRNWLGHITQQDDPDLGIWTYTYKPNGEVLTQTDAKGQVITYDYDSRNRLKTKTYTNVSSPEPQVALAYDIGANGNGKLYSISKGGVVITNAAYNETGQLIQKTMSMDSQNYNIYYNYNPAGQINEITYPDAYSVNYTYHPGTGLISSVSAISPDINITIPSYSAFGKIKTIQYPGFASTLNYFDRTGRLDSINVPSLMAFEYDYTRAGDVLSKYDSIRSLSYTYGYDALHRLTTESAIGPFSGFQDRTLNMYYESSAPHAVSRVNTGLGERTNIYDLNGNLTTGYDFKTPGLFPERRITYNAENMPLTIEYQPEGAPVVSVNYTYDGNGRRVKKQAGTDIVKYIDNVYELRNEQATKYVFAGNLRLAKIKGSNVQFYHKDHLGSSSVLSDENGVLTESVAYEPYGSQRKLFCAPESTDLNYTFTDQEWDAETGLYNYDARLYDSVLGRFITADNVIPNWHDPQTLDRYSYTRNNPLKYVDPDGHNFISLNDPTGAMDYGHNASLVGNNDVGWHYFSKDKNGIKNQTHSYFTTFENFLKSPLSQRYATGYDVETTPDQDEQMINKGFEIYKNEYDIHKNNCADLNAEIGDKGGVKIAKPKDKSPLLSKNFTGPNLQQEKLRKNEPKGNERNLIQERKEIRRKLYDKIRERKRSK